MPNKKYIWPAVIAAAGALGSAAVNWFSNKKTNDSNKEINQSQIDYSREAFENEKEYNNFLLGNQRQMQMQDMKSSGMNPAFVQGSNLGGSTISPHQQLPNQIPMDYRFDTGINEGVSNYLTAQMNKALIRKANVDADLTEAQKDRQLIENEYMPKLLQSQFDLNTSNVKLIGQNVHLTHKQADKVASEILAITKQMQLNDAQISELHSRVAVLGEEQKIKAATAALQSDLMQAQIKELSAKYKFTEEQTKYYAANVMAQIFNLKADSVLKGSQSKNVQVDTSLKGVQAEYTQQQTVESKAKTSNIAADTNLKHVQKEQVYWNAQQNKLDFEIDSDYKRTERKLAAAKMTADIAVSATQAAKNAADIVKPW